MANMVAFKARERHIGYYNDGFGESRDVDGLFLPGKLPW